MLIQDYYLKERSAKHLKMNGIIYKTVISMIDTTNYRNSMQHMGRSNQFVTGS